MRRLRPSNSGESQTSLMGSSSADSFLSNGEDPVKQDSPPTQGYLLFRILSRSGICSYIILQRYLIFIILECTSNSIQSFGYIIDMKIGVGYLVT